MPRVIGIDPGTVSIDLCGLEDGTVFLDRSFPTAAALADPGAFVALLTDAGPLDLIAGPSGYGLPLVRAREATEEDLRLAFLAAEGEAGGIGGLRALARALARSGLPVVLTPGVIHLTSVPEHRKVNRVDMGTADKVCVAALAIAEQAERTTRPPRSEEHTSELQSPCNLVCRLLLEKKKTLCQWSEGLFNALCDCDTRIQHCLI